MVTADSTGHDTCLAAVGHDTCLANGNACGDAAVSRFLATGRRPDGGRTVTGRRPDGDPYCR